MIFYADEVTRKLKKKSLPKQIYVHFDNAFKSLELTNDLSLFDIKKLKGSVDSERIYYRLRKGKYRAIFYIEDDNYYVIAIDKREEVYRKWQ